MNRLLSEDEFLSRVEQIPLQPLVWGDAKRKGIEVLVRRDDLIDVHLTGNKFYKLFYNLQAAKNMGHSKLLSFGGAYSNHIYALAAAAKLYGFKAIGVIRGERPKQLSATLLDAEAWGMQLHFISRSDYREKSSPILLDALKTRFGDFFVIPEGGANSYGLMGTKALGAAIYQQVKSDYTAVCVACGTANSLAGIAAGLLQNATTTDASQVALGFSVLAGQGDLGIQIKNHQEVSQCETNNWRLISGFHGGGYAKKLPAALHQFMIEFEQETKLRLDPVYTVKMCWGVSRLIAENYWPSGSRLILVHTGGLQGRRGFNLP